MSIFNSPLTSDASMLPSLLILTTSRSSARSVTPSPPPPPPAGRLGFDAGPGAAAGASTIPISSSSACMALNTSWDCFVLLPSCIPLPLGGALTLGRSSSTAFDTRATVFRSSSRKPPPPPPPPPAHTRFP